MILRDYQQAAITLTGQALRNKNKRIIINLATAAGKSPIFKEIIKKFLGNGNKVLFMVKRRELVFQAVNKHLKEFDPSIIMGSEKGLNKEAQLQCASIDTLMRRIEKEGYEFLKGSVIILDEAHDYTSDRCVKVLEWLESPYVIGLTATPFIVNNRAHEFFDHCVEPITVQELEDQGFITKLKLYGPSKPDLSEVKMSMGDYNKTDLYEAMSKSNITANILETWKELAQDKPTICFAVNIAHSKSIVKRFNEAGIPAIHCDQSTSKEDRAEAISYLEEGHIKILSSVDIFSTGSDIMGLGACILARPTKSETLFIQQIGRARRPYSICSCGEHYAGNQACYTCGKNDPAYRKPYAIILDHAGNCEQNGLPNDYRPAKLTKPENATKKSKLDPVKTCKKCFAINVGSAVKCAECGEVFEYNEEEVKEVDGVLVEIQQIKNERYAVIAKKINELKATQEARNYKSSWVGFKVFEEFGSELRDHDEFYKEFKMHFMDDIKVVETAEEAKAIAKTWGYHWKWVTHKRPDLFTNY